MCECGAILEDLPAEGAEGGGIELCAGAEVEAVVVAFMFEIDGLSGVEEGMLNFFPRINSKMRVAVDLLGFALSIPRISPREGHNTNTNIYYLLTLTNDK